MRVACSKSCILSLAFVLFTIVSSSTALVSTPYPKAVSDLKDVVKGLAFQADDFKISGCKSLGLLEEPARPGDENELVEQKGISDYGLPVLAPFQLAGPMELWIQDAKDMRISLPHDVDAGVLKKVILADSAVVTVKGARSVSLRHSVDLPLLLNRTYNGFASGLMALALSIFVLGPKANKKGYFKLLKADVAAQTFVKIGFGVEKKLKEGDGFSLEGFPEWRTKP
ncbi:hypothetical protein F3Y22_tig00110597pilonHSYRG00860 [Hibiscus syriacus]|uniref:Uncharacterized protein n=1 Tax=Hibiscus syriacus TaxID=106335 RepID=A0A6A3A6G6_HIBSY|nr:hypothetical protein F3Y22_tig00110597pilonHSYRG00860 [Hibiscus syriacus]